MNGAVGILPAYIRYTSKLSASAKLLYAEITANLDETGLYCNLTNREFAENLGGEERTIQRLLANLIHYKVIERVQVGKVRQLTLRIPHKIIRGDNPPHSHEVVEFTRELIAYWNKLFASSIAYRSMYVDMVAERLLKFSKKDIGLALQQWHRLYAEDEYWKENRSNLIDITNVIASDESVERFLKLNNNETKNNGR
jgi:hypothetical protein